jgi:hypothetical protein
MLRMFLQACKGTEEKLKNNKISLRLEAVLFLGFPHYAA